MNLRQGVAIFPAQGFPVSSSYLDLVQTKFGGNAQNLAYTPPQEATDTINHWAQERTGDQVQELVTNLDSQTQLLLATVAFYQSMYHLSSVRPARGGVTRERAGLAVGGRVTSHLLSHNVLTF